MMATDIFTDEQQIANLNLRTNFLQTFPDEGLMEGFTRVLSTPRQNVIHTLLCSLGDDEERALADNNQWSAKKLEFGILTYESVR